MYDRVKYIINLLEECEIEIKEYKRELKLKNETSKNKNEVPKLYRCSVSYTEDGDLGDPAWLIANSYDEAFMKFDDIFDINEDKLYYELVECEPEEDGTIDANY